MSESRSSIDSARSTPASVHIDDDNNDEAHERSISENESSTSSRKKSTSPDLMFLPRSPSRRPKTIESDNTSDRRAPRRTVRPRSSTSADRGLKNSIRTRDIRTRISNKRVNDELEPLYPIQTNIGVLNIGVKISNHVIFKLYQTGGKIQSMSEYKNHNLQNRALDALVIARVSRVAKRIDLKNSMDTDFTWTNCLEDGGAPVLGTQLWIHGQSTRISVNKFKGIVISVPQLDAAEKALAATLLDNSKLDPKSHHRPNRQPDPSARRADVADVNMDQERQAWALFLNIPFLSMGNPNAVSGSDSHYLYSQPLIQHLYPLEALRTSGDKQQTLHKTGVLAPKSAILVSQFWAMLTSSGPLITLCPETFTSLHQPYLTSSTVNQPIGMLGSKKVQIHIPSNDDFAFTFPLTMCASYFGLKSCISDALQDFLDDQVDEYSIQGQSGLEIDEFKWATYYKEQITSTIELTIIEATANTQRTQSAAASTRSSLASGAEDESAAVTQPTEDFFTGLKITPFLMWSDEIEDTNQSSLFQAKVTVGVMTTQRARPARTRLSGVAALRSQTRPSQLADEVPSRPTATDRALTRIEKQLPRGSRDVREATRPSVRMRKSLTGRTVDSFYESVKTTELSPAIQENIADFLHQYTAPCDDVNFGDHGLDWQRSLAEMTRFSQTISDAFCSSEYSHTLVKTSRQLMQRLFMDIRNTYEATEGLQPLSPPVRTSGDRNNGGIPFTPVIQPFTGPAMLFDTSKPFWLEDNESLLKSIFKSNCQTCEIGESGTEFDDYHEAISHLREQHNLNSQTITDVDLGRYIIPAADYLKFEVRAHLNITVHGFRLQLKKILQMIRQIQAGAAFDDNLPSCIFTLPKELEFAYEIFLTATIHVGHMITCLRDIVEQSLRDDEETLMQYLQPYSQKFHYLMEHGEEMLLAAKKELEYRTIMSGHSSHRHYDHMGMAYVLSATIGGLCDRGDTMNGLDILQAYDDYAQRIDYQVRRHPRRRLRNDIIQCREELVATLDVFDSQRTVIQSLRQLLDPSNFEDPSPSRKYKNRFEREALETFDNNSQDREEYCKELLRDLERLETELIRGIEVDQDDHGKAILAFTIVTVVFLPLSFATSFLGMNTTDIRDTDASQWLYWAIAIPLTLITMAGAIIVGYYGDGIRDRSSAMVKSLFPRRKQRNSDAAASPPSQVLDAQPRPDTHARATGIEKPPRPETV